MPISLQRLETTGEVNYIQKHNSNYELLEGTVNSLNQLLTASQGSSLSLGSLIFSLLGTSNAFIGSTSYAIATSGKALTVSPGYFWKPSSNIVLGWSNASAFDFTALAASTYYVCLGPTGQPFLGTVQEEPLWSVVWSGTAFGALTRMAGVRPGSDDWEAVQSSAALATSFLTLDARLEAGELVAKDAQARVSALEVAQGVRPLDVYTYYPGVPSASAMILKAVIGRTATIPANFAGSIADAEVPASASTVFTLRKNGTQIGTITFAAGATIGTWSTTSAISLAIGDKLTLLAPAGVDATLADLSFTLLATR